jgi:DNA-binding response OmpR family regulator
MENRTIRVLLVEDDDAYARLVKEMLTDAQQARFSLEWCVRLSAAETALREDVFDAILLDLALPDSQGLETFHRMYIAAAGTPIIIVTGLDDRQVVLGAISSGARDYFVKGRVDSYLLERAILRQVQPECRPKSQAAGAGDGQA